MFKKSSNILFIGGIYLCMTIFYSISVGWYSFGICSLGVFFLSILYLNRNYLDEQRQLIKLFVLFYSVYSLYTYITNFLYVKDPSLDFFMMVDSKKFWIYSDYEINSLGEVWEIQKGNLLATSRYFLFNFINLFLSFLAQLTDENNILLQKLQSIWLGAFSIPFIYLSLRKYFDKDRSFLYSCIFGFLSHVFIYSTAFNRDPHVYFLFTIGTYLLVHYETKKNILLKLFFLFILIAGFRLESGLFFTVYFVAYLYLKSQRNKNLFTILVAIVPLAIVVLSPFLLTKFQDRSEVFQEQMERAERSENSAGASFSKLPPGPRQAFMAINSQIAPAVPFWRDWFPDKESIAFRKHSSAGYFTPWRFPENIAALFMIALWGVIVGGIYFKKFTKIPKELKVLFFVSILFLLAASSSINPRRTYCVYPIVFLVGTYIFNLLTKKQQALVKQYSTVFVIFIYLIFIVFKGI